MCFLYLKTCLKKQNSIWSFLHAKALFWSCNFETKETKGYIIIRQRRLMTQMMAITVMLNEAQLDYKSRKNSSYSYQDSTGPNPNPTNNPNHKFNSIKIRLTLTIYNPVIPLYDLNEWVSDPCLLLFFISMHFGWAWERDRDNY